MDKWYLVEENELIDLIAAWHKLQEFDPTCDYTEYYDKAREEVEQNYAKSEYSQ